MKPPIILIALFLGGILVPSALPATAADVASGRHSTPSQQPPFPLSERARSVWASGACWSECGSYCAWGLTGCLAQDAQGRCLKLTDACDRSCQRQCRTSGGPLLPIDF